MLGVDVAVSAVVPKLPKPWIIPFSKSILRLSLNLPALILHFSFIIVPPSKSAPLKVDIPALTTRPPWVTWRPFLNVDKPITSWLVKSS